MGRKPMKNFRVSEEQDAAIKKAADDAGLALSTWIRAVVLGAAGRPDLVLEDAEPEAHELAKSIASGSAPVTAGEAELRALEALDQLEEAAAELRASLGAEPVRQALRISEMIDEKVREKLAEAMEDERRWEAIASSIVDAAM